MGAFRGTSRAISKLEALFLTIKRGHSTFRRTFHLRRKEPYLLEICYQELRL